MSRKSRPLRYEAFSVSADEHRAEAAVDALRRGRIIGLTDGGRGLALLSAELADATSLAALEGHSRASLIITARRAAVLHLTNQRAAAVDDAEPVWVERPGWLDLAGSRAVADPVLDLATPLKGPFTSRALGADRLAARAAITIAKHAALLPALYAVSIVAASPVVTAPASAVLALPATAADLRLSARAHLPLSLARGPRE